MSSLCVIEDFIQKGEGTFHINATDQIEVVVYLGKCYVCFKQIRVKENKEYINRMNFDVEMWNRIKSPEDQKKHRKRRGKKTNEQEKKNKKTVTQYGCVLNEIVSWYFTEAEVHRLAPNDVINMTREIYQPTLNDVSEMVAQYQLMTLILTEMKKGCVGCEFDHPIQIQHLAGCLMDWPVAVESYFDEVTKFTNPDTFKPAVMKIIKILGIENITDDISIDLEKTRTQLVDSVIPSDYMSLFTHVLS